MSTSNPNFYEQIPSLKIYEPLSAFFGVTNDGIITYRYPDVVKLTGHSCPTVVAAYLMTLRALQRLYDKRLPVRGEIEVYFRDQEASGVTGVMANVVSFLTGAAGEGGFKGLAGRFDRRHLLNFGAPIDEQIGFRRRDTGAAVQVRFDGTVVPASLQISKLFDRVLTAPSDSQECEQFQTLWQDRLRRLLVDHCEDPRLVVLSDWNISANVDCTPGGLL